MKNKIRKEILALRKKLPEKVVEKNSNEIIRKTRQHPVYLNAELILAYIDTNGEVQTKKLIEDAWNQGKKVAVPKVQGDIMHFYLIESYDQLVPGDFGIQEPKEDCWKIEELTDNTLVIMPGVAFDRAGNRIGYGKGYYDKYFGQYPDIYKIAIAFEMQIIESIPADEYDVSADEVITEL